MTVVRALAFGDLDARSWGVAWLPEGAGVMSVALAAGSAGSTVPVTLQDEGEDGGWRVRGQTVDLLLSPLSELVPVEATGEESHGCDELCHVSGSFELDGSRHDVDALGWRATRTLGVEDKRLDSFRQVSAWFEPGDAVALLALRPHRARGHDADVIAGGLCEPGGAVAVFDPRLSTTYAQDGWPMRAGVELWIDGEGPERPGEPETDSAGAANSVHQYPRRIAGEALGPHANWTVDGFALRAELFRWHSRGRDGAGVYLLGARTG